MNENIIQSDSIHLIVCVEINAKMLPWVNWVGWSTTTWVGWLDWTTTLLFWCRAKGDAGLLLLFTSKCWATPWLLTESPYDSFTMAVNIVITILKKKTILEINYLDQEILLEIDNQVWLDQKQTSLTDLRGLGKLVHFWNLNNYLLELFSKEDCSSRKRRRVWVSKRSSRFYEIDYFTENLQFLRDQFEIRFYSWEW